MNINTLSATYLAVFKAEQEEWCSLAQNLSFIPIAKHKKIETNFIDRL